MRGLKFRWSFVSCGGYEFGLVLVLMFWGICGWCICIILSGGVIN